jgi:hypothetical protein
MNLVQKYNDYRLYPSICAVFSSLPCDSHLNSRQTKRIPLILVVKCSFPANNLEF